jgi:hypothetical protein
MVSILRRLSIAAVLLFTGAGRAFGGDYADPSGFSFTYPEGWIPLNRSMKDVGQALPPEMKNWLAKNNVDLNRVAVVLLRKGRGDFIENLNVVIDKQQIPANDATVKQMIDMLPQKFAAMGANLDNIQGRVQRIGSSNAVVLDFQTRLPGVPFSLRQRQVYFPGGGKTYIVTCTAKADSFDQYQPTFENILASFQSPAPHTRAFDWSRVMTQGVMGGIVAGSIGIIAWLLLKKALPKRRSAGTADANEL